MIQSDLTKRKYKKKCADGEVRELRCQYDVNFLSQLNALICDYEDSLKLEFTFRDIAQEVSMLFWSGGNASPQDLNRVLDRIKEEEKKCFKKRSVYADRILILASEYNPTPENAKDVEDNENNS